MIMADMKCNFEILLLLKRYLSLMRKTLKGIEARKMKSKPDQDIFLNKKIVAPEKLKILVLSGNDIVNDQLEFIHRCVNLIKLDISNNHITKVTPKIQMGQLTKLKILAMHNNRIQHVQGLEGIFSIPNLVHLTIKENPIEKIPRIEHLIINMIPTLKILGERVVFVEQRSADVFDARENIYIEPELAEGWKSKDNHQAHYIKILELQLRYFENVWFFSNPIIKIQRFWKSLHSKLKEKKIKSRIKGKNTQFPEITHSQEISVAAKFFREWKDWARKRKAITKALDDNQQYLSNHIYLTYPYEEYLVAKRNFRVNEIVKRYIEYIRQKIFMRKMAKKIQRQLKKKQDEFNSQVSFFEQSGIKQNKRFYFSKIQSHLIENFLAHIGNNFGWKQRIEKSVSYGGVDEYLAIRVVDPETFAVKVMYTAFTYFLWPSMKVIFLKKKKIQSTQKTGMIKIKPLYYIKNKNKRVTPEEFKKSCKVYRKLQKFYHKEYANSVDYFQCDDDQIMKMLLRYIYYHNTKTIQLPNILKKNQMQSLLQNYEEPFMLYADNLIKRTAAAVRIQQNWRKYLVNKKKSNSIYLKMKATRAVYRIQRFWRDQVFYHRMSFHKTMFHQLKLFTDNSIMIPTSLYNVIEEVCSSENKVMLYDKIQIFLNRTNNRFHCEWDYQNSVIPEYICQKYFPWFNSESIGNIQEVYVYEILHFRANVSKKEYNSNSYFQFQFQSIEECRLRVYLLALLSYRIYGSLMFIPLSKQTIKLQQIRLESYQKLPPLNETQIFQNKLSKLHPSEQNKSKINTIRNYTEDGFFLFTGDPPKRSQVYQIQIQFYQKMFRDFPKKYSDNLSYILPKEVVENVKQEKKKVVEGLIEKTRLEERDIEEQKLENIIKKNNALNKPRKPITSQQDMTDIFNISRVNKNTLNMYDIGSKTGTNFKEQKETLTQARLFANTAQISERKSNVSKIKEHEKSKKEELKEKKKANLTQIKDSRKKQKDFSTNVMNMKELERTENIKKQADKVRSFKSRLSHSKRRESEEDFIQQGNFVMEQQLKMVIMRSKINNLTNKPKREKSEFGSRKHRSFMLNSELTNHDKSDAIIQAEVKNQTVPVRSHQAMHQESKRVAREENEYDIEGGQRKIVNLKNMSRKNRTQSIGAYMRDPSFVHGVFPQEYYPISSKGSTAFKFFPPL